MNQSTIDDIKADAFAYVAGIQFTASSYLTYTEEEHNCWEEGILDAIECFKLEPPEAFDVGCATDGYQEMDLSTPFFGWESIEDCSCH